MSVPPLPEELESLVQAARSDLPDAPFVARLENAVLSSAVARVGRRRLSWRARPAMLAAAAVIFFAVAGPAAVLWWRARPHGTPPPTVPTVAAPVALVAPAPVSAAEGTAAEERPREPEAALVAPVKRRASASAGRQPAATEAEPVVLPEPEISGPSELALMEQAQALTATNPAQALALCAEHQQRFARGVLSEEREVIAVEALRRLGRRAEAQARAIRFLRDRPGSAYRARMQAALDAGAF